MPEEVFPFSISTGLAMDQQTLDFLTNAIPHLLWITDARGYLLYANGQAFHYTGLRNDEMPGFLWSQIIHPRDRFSVLRAWKVALTTETNLYCEARLKRADGIYRWHTIRASAQRNPEGAIKLWIGTATEREYQEQQEQPLEVSAADFHALAETGPQMIWCSLGDGTLIYCNQRYLEYVQAPFEELQGSGWQRFVYQEDVARILLARQKAQETGKPYELEYRLKEGKTGTYRWFLRQVMPVLDARGQIRKWFGLSTDIHEQKCTEKEVERQKDFFLAMTSHELKTPLAALKGTLQLMERRMKSLASGSEIFSPAARGILHDCLKRLEGAKRQVDIQTHLINDLLDLSRLATQTFQLDLDTWDLVQLVQETIDNLCITAPERSLALCLTEHSSVLVLADRERIRQVITNYVTNALRYAPPEQPIQIGVTLQEKSVRVWVRDRGPGLTPEAQKNVWQRFHQIKGVSGQEGSGKGLGLGLYLCQQLIKAHRGQVGVESTLGKGSTFWFQLPRTLNSNTDTFRNNNTP